MTSRFQKIVAVLLAGYSGDIIFVVRVISTIQNSENVSPANFIPLEVLNSSISLPSTLKINGGRRGRRDSPTRIPKRPGQEDNEARQGHQQGELGSSVPRLLLRRALPSILRGEVRRGCAREETQDGEARTRADGGEEAPADERFPPRLASFASPAVGSTATQPISLRFR